MIKWYERVLLIIIFCLLFSIITFSAENLIVSINNMVANKKFDIAFRGGDNSHLGNWLLSLVFVFIFPLYFKLLHFLSIKNKLFSNLWFVCFITTLLCFLFEFISGIILNIVLKLNFWDYSFMEIKINNIKIAFHLFGQINIFYFPVWFFTILFALILYKSLFSIDIKFVRTVISETINILKILFKNRGKITDSYFNIKADYLEKYTNDT